ncbi:MAG: glucose-1-phosphate cytidylyltransferase [Gemmatimonas sp.]
MKAIILCGGLGTRMREETEYRPKPMVDIGGRPILWHILKYYAKFDVRDFVLCLGYKGQMIKDYFLNYEAMNSDFTMSLGRLSAISYHAPHEEQDFRVTLADTGANTMTGGRVARVKKYVGNERFLVTYGDGLTDLDLADALRFHESHGRLATVCTVRPTSRFGMMDVDATGAVERFAEKPTLDGWVNAGYFIFEPEVFEYLDTSEGCILEREPLEKLAAEGELMAYRHDGFFFAMDTYREYLQLNEMWDQNRAPWWTPRKSVAPARITPRSVRKTA